MSKNIITAILEGQTDVQEHEVCGCDACDWQISEIKNGVDEADSNQLISHNEVIAKFEEQLLTSITNE